jgi:two-component system sensor histidine kinase DegS
VVLRAEYCLMLLYRNPGRIEDELGEIAGLARSTLEDMRRIVFELRPLDFDAAGFIPGIRHYIADFQEKTGIQINFKTKGENRRYPPVVEIGVFRVIQEALNNIRRHAEVDRADVTLLAGEKEVSVTVRDQGRGFSLEEAQEQIMSFGLKGMRERIQFLGGSLEVTSLPGKGTTVKALIPVKVEVEPVEE